MTGLPDAENNADKSNSTPKSEHFFSEINRCLINLGSDYHKNVNELTALCGQLLNATFARYNRLDSKMLCTFGQWNIPGDYDAVVAPEGRICNDVIATGQHQPVLLNDLTKSGYMLSDPDVVNFNLKSYAGYAVFLGGKAIGALSVVYNNSRNLDAHELGVLSMLASALGSEEQRLSDRKALLDSEKKNRKLSSLLRMMADTMPDMIWAKNLKKEYIFVNKAISAKLLNATDTEEPLGKTDQFFAERENKAHPDNPHWHTFGRICSETDSVTLQSMKHMQFDEMGYAKGEFLFLDVNKAPLFDEDGTLIGIVGSARDVTVAKELEQNLIHQSELRDLLMEISAGFVNIPLDLVDAEVNKVLKILALFVRADRAYIFEYDWENRVSNNTYEWCAEGISSEISNLQSLPVDMMGATLESHRKGESEYISDISAIPEENSRRILEAQGIKSMITVPMMHKHNCIGFVGFDSVREHHRYTDSETQLLKLFGQLLANVHLRKDIERQLVRAKEKAEESDNLKTSFINNISHEIRTPLNGILGFAHLLARPDVAEQERASLYEFLNQSCNRLLNTMNDYMDMAMIVSKTMVLNKTNVGLDQVVDAISEDAAWRCARKNLEFRLKSSTGVAGAVAYTDRNFLLRILGKLIDNAVKFTETGTVEVAIHLADSKLECSVSDSGCGIDSDMVEKIFEMFSQTDTSLSRGYEGSGLGLAIAKGLVSLLEGSITVSSVKGQGSVFTFAVPLRIVEEASTAKAWHDSEDSSIPHRSLVLIAEDDDLNSQYMMALLDAEGIDYIHAENGKAAVELCRNNPDISFVLMDVKMPLMNGEEATRKIREFRPGLPIVATTAYARTGDAKKFLDAGCVEYVAKPISRDKILNLLGKFDNYTTTEQEN